MNTRKNLILAFCFICFSNCSFEKDLENKDVDIQLAKISVDSVFRLADVNPVLWDSVYFSTPYTYSNLAHRLDSIGVFVPERIDKKLSSLNMFDNFSVLLFFHEKKLVNYSCVLTTNANFYKIDTLNKGLSAKDRLKLTTNRMVILE